MSPNRLYIVILLFPILLSLTACGGGIATAIGLGPTATTWIKGFGTAKLGVDAGLAVAGEKSTNEMILSAVTEKDCAFIRILEDRDVCIEHVKKNTSGVSWEYQSYHHEQHPW
tara:strand:- start:45 stop:383 length:339 start_codon:yes stop_codon:yes gene_type:complete